jgi:hypothetical protein
MCIEELTCGRWMSAEGLACVHNVHCCMFEIAGTGAWSSILNETVQYLVIGQCV